MTRRDLCVTLPRPHLPVTPLTLSKPSYQEEKDIAIRGTSSHAQLHPGTARDKSADHRRCEAALDVYASRRGSEVVRVIGFGASAYSWPASFTNLSRRGTRPLPTFVLPHGLAGSDCLRDCTPLKCLPRFRGVLKSTYKVFQVKLIVFLVGEETSAVTSAVVR